MKDVLSLDEGARQSVVEYVQLQKLKKYRQKE